MHCVLIGAAEVPRLDVTGAAREKERPVASDESIDTCFIVYIVEYK